MNDEDPRSDGYVDKQRILREKSREATKLPSDLVDSKKRVYLSRHWYKPPATFTVGDTVFKDQEAFLKRHRLINGVFLKEQKIDNDKLRVTGFDPDKNFKEERMSEETSFGIYNVYFYYGGKGKEDFEQMTIIARDSDDAKVKSGFYDRVSKDWDSRYLTIFATRVANIRREE